MLRPARLPLTLDSSPLQGIDLQSAPTAPSFDPRAWGFPRTLPDADTLFAAFARRARRPSTKDVAAGPDGPHGSQQQQEEESYLVSLQQSRTFQSPDCADSQAAAFGAAAELRCLRGSLLSGGPAPSEEGVASLRAHVKGRVASAWSDEALRRGVALAKAGDTEGAMPCYNQVGRRPGGACSGDKALQGDAASQPSALNAQRSDDRRAFSLCRQSRCGRGTQTPLSPAAPPWPTSRTCSGRGRIWRRLWS